MGPGYESECESQWEDRASRAKADGCDQEYEALLAYLWYDQEPNAPCTDLEATFVNLCPTIDVRDAD